ncbi:CoA transferase [Streptomyces sp. NPDC051913]|uniref:CoA transferase n=1 Tax=Streptomyces sp. NPDC051913 TaxID=3365676 RepID=UPI0037D8121E
MAHPPDRTAHETVAHPPDRTAHSTEPHRPNQTAYSTEPHPHDWTAYRPDEHHPHQSAHGTEPHHPNRTAHGTQAQHPDRTAHGTETQHPDQTAHGTHAQHPDQTAHGTHAQHPDQTAHGTHAQHPDQTAHGTHAQHPTRTTYEPADLAHDWARSGVLPLTGHAAGPPLLPPGAAATFAARLGGLAGVDGALLLAERAALSGGGRRGRVSVGGSCRLLPTRDGWAAVSDARPDDHLLWGAAIGGDVALLPSWLAAHTGAQLDERVELLGLAGGAVRPAPGRGCPLPGPPRDVRGMLVVDFSALWAGPLCAHLLGLAGAEVVKVETPDRPDGARRSNADFYDLLHSGHASVVLDPSEPRDRVALHALVRRADVVIEASRPRALAGFGLDARAEAERGCTWISITAFGRSSYRVGFGDDVAASRGLLAADAEGRPVFVGDAVADPLTGLLAAALALSEQPSEQPKGTVWDVSMADVVTTTLAVPPLAAEVVRAGDRWFLDTGTAAPWPVTPPVPRRPSTAAPASGADTSAVLRRLGIR